MRIGGVPSTVEEVVPVRTVLLFTWLKDLHPIEAQATYFFSPGYPGNLAGMSQTPPPGYCSKTLCPKKVVAVDVSDILLFFSARGTGRGSPMRDEGGGVSGEGERLGRVSVVFFFLLGGGGRQNVFFFWGGGGEMPTQLCSCFRPNSC